MEVLIAVLAAGESSRLGQPKQLLQKDNQSLLRYTITQCRPLADLMVITGAFESEIQKEIPENIPQLHNPEWKAGMGSTIRLAAHYADDKGYSKLLFVPVDLPKVTTRHYRKLLDTAASREYKIVCAGFSGTFGIPTVFDKVLFEELKNFTDDEGAKGLINRYIGKTYIIPIPEAAHDIDLPGDIEKIL